MGTNKDTDISFAAEMEAEVYNIAEEKHLEDALTDLAEEKKIDGIGDDDLDNLARQIEPIDSFLVERFNPEQEGLTKYGYSLRARKHLKKNCEACEDKTRLQGHHKDGDRSNNKRENIQTLCIYCHKFLHDTMKRRGLKVPGGLSPAFVPILQG